MWWKQKSCGQGLVDTRLDEWFVLVMVSRAGNSVIVECRPDNRHGGRVFMIYVAWRTNTFHPKNNAHCSHYAVSCLLLTEFNHTHVGHLASTGAIISSTGEGGYAIIAPASAEQTQEILKNMVNISHRLTGKVQHIEVWGQ